MTINFKERASNFTYLTVSLFLLVFAALKAYNAPLYWDEMYTYQNYVKENIFLLSHYSRLDANDHLLNTWLIELCIKIFGRSEFILRLPNVLMYPLFLYFSFLLTNKFRPKIIAIAGFLIINLNPFTFDYFSVARGYGLGLSFMMASLYFAYLFVEEKKTYLNCLYSIVFATLAMLSNFTFLNYLIVLTSLFLSINFIRLVYERSIDRKHFINELLKRSALILSPFLAFIIVLPVIIQLRKAQALFVGGEHGFWPDTVKSLIEKYFGNFFVSVDLMPYAQIFVVLILLSSLIVVCAKIYKNRIFDAINFHTFLFSALVLCFLANYVQHLLLDVPYAFYRTAIYYYPPFLLLLICFIQLLYSRFKKITYLLYVLPALLIINFFADNSIYYLRDWSTEEDVKHAIDCITQRRAKNQQNQNDVTLGLGLNYKDDFIFYKEFHQLDWLSDCAVGTLYHPLNDFYFIYKKDLNKMPDIKSEIVAEFKKSQAVLIENKQGWRKTEIVHQYLDFERPEDRNQTTITDELSFSGKHCSKTDDKQPYGGGIVYIISDTLLKCEISKLNFKAMVYSSLLSPNARIVISFERNGAAYSWSSFELGNYLKEKRSWTKVEIDLYLPKGLKKSDEVKCFLWNRGNIPVYIDNLDFSIFGYSKTN